MRWSPLAKTTITVVRTTETGVRDDFGVPGKTQTATPVPGCLVDPLMTYEQAPQQTDSGWSKWRVYAPPNADITPADKIKVDGLPDLQVDGEVMRRPGPRGGVHHLEFQATRWFG